MARPTAPPPTVMPIGPLVRIDAVSEATGLSTYQIKRAVREGRLRAYRLSGTWQGPLSFSAHDVNEFIAAGRVEPSDV